MGEKRGTYRVLVGKREGGRPLGKPRRTWEDNIKMDLQEGLNRSDSTGDRWRALVNAVMSLWVP